MPGYVYKLQRKLELCAETLSEVGLLKSAKLDHLAAYIGVPLPTIRSACAIGKISEAVEEKLCDKCDFPNNNQYWIDTTQTDDERRLAKDTYSGRDTPFNFRKFIRHTWRLPVASGLILKGTQRSLADELFASFAIVSTGQQISTDGVIIAFLEIDINLMRYEDERNYVVFYGFNRMIFQIVLQDDIKLTSRLGLNSPEAVSNGLLRARGTSQDPYWELSVNNGVLDGDYSTKSPIFEINDARENCALKAFLKVHLHDGSLRRKDAQPFQSVAKQRVAELLMSRCIGKHKNGYITIGIQKLAVVKDVRF